MKVESIVVDIKKEFQGALSLQVQILPSMVDNVIIWHDKYNVIPKVGDKITEIMSDEDVVYRMEINGKVVFDNKPIIKDQKTGKEIATIEFHEFLHSGSYELHLLYDDFDKEQIRNLISGLQRAIGDKE